MKPALPYACTISRLHFSFPVECTDLHGTYILYSMYTFVYCAGDILANTQLYSYIYNYIAGYIGQNDLYSCIWVLAKMSPAQYMTT